ncbi:TetR/AcrR family transcriptional regulator [Bergeyella sp. RCAD1439]|uniref:TetR/AcrR family transcriptional regulator n=1 Tax=Bergeyella anatis TaxID=3113737 RepID=UPI002E174AB9|nr:TetR family transcriptional regulator [Bergeyella sp. RCAD1439]
MKKKFTEKQIHILDVAEELIAQKGFDGTSVRDISQKAGINVAMISYYFGSKEKMLAYLYQYRVQRTRESFSEFAHTIREGKPEMQMKEIIRFIINQMFRFHYFHAFVKQEIRHTELVKDDLVEFYKTATEKIDEVIKKGIASGVFHYAPKPEDILTYIIGSAVFAIRNRTFFENYLPGKPEDFIKQAEQKIKASNYQTIFSLLGYQPDPIQR